MTDSSQVQKMTREAFAPYGIVLDSRGAVEIDLGRACRASRARLPTRGRSASSSWRGTARRCRSFRRSLASQAVICVAPPNGARCAGRGKSRRVPCRTGGCLTLIQGDLAHAAVSASASGTSYLVVDRSGTLDDDWELVDLKTARGCTFEIDLNSRHRRR